MTLYHSPFSPHPYIFFNEDRVTVTFVGFNVTRNGNLVSSINKQILESKIMDHRLYDGLKHNRVDFEEDYHSWKKPMMIKKLSIVMCGEEHPHDPDKSYVLTVDNLIKILAIQMRFR